MKDAFIIISLVGVGMIVGALLNNRYEYAVIKSTTNPSLAYHQQVEAWLKEMEETCGEGNVIEVCTTESCRQPNPIFRCETYVK